MQIKLIFIREVFHEVSFETEAQGNLEMAYLKWIIKYSLNSEMPATKELRNTQRIFVQR